MDIVVEMERGGPVSRSIEMSRPIFRKFHETAQLKIKAVFAKFLSESSVRATNIGASFRLQATLLFYTLQSRQICSEPVSILNALHSHGAEEWNRNK
jgi:hypothetical protein